MSDYDKIKHTDHQKKNPAENKPGHIYTEEDAAQVIDNPLLVEEGDKDRTLYYGEIGERSSAISARDAAARSC